MPDPETEPDSRAHPEAAHRCPDEMWQAAGRALNLAEAWAQECARLSGRRPFRLLAELLEDQEGLIFTTRFLDQVIGAYDADASAKALVRLSAQRPKAMSSQLAGALGLGKMTSRFAPKTAHLLARRGVQELIGDSIITDPANAPRARRAGQTPELVLLAGAAWGNKQAARRREAVTSLLDLDGVERLTVPLAAITRPAAKWGMDSAKAEAVRVLTPLLRHAQTFSKRLSLEAGQTDVALVADALMAALDQEELAGCPAGLALPASAPGVLSVLRRFSQWADQRASAGGEPLRLRLLLDVPTIGDTNQGINPHPADDDHAEAEPLSSTRSRVRIGPDSLRVLSWALSPERSSALMLALATGTLSATAFVHELVASRNLPAALQPRQGLMAGTPTGIKDILCRDLGDLGWLQPIAVPGEPETLIPHVIGWLHAAPEGMLSGSTDPTRLPQAVTRNGAHLLEDLAGLDLRAEPQPVPVGATRPEAPSPEVLQASQTLAGSNRGVAAVAANQVELAAPGAVDKLLGRLARSAPFWRVRPAQERAAILEQAAELIESRRAELLEVAVAETGMVLSWAEREVTRAVAMCRHQAQLARGLDQAACTPSSQLQALALTAIATSRHAPLSVPAAEVAGVLAAGGAAVLKPSPVAGRCAAELLRIFHDAGVPKEVLALAAVDDASPSRAVLTNRHVDSVLLAGSASTAKLLRSWKQDMDLRGKLRGRNTFVVTASADPARAVRDAVASAFAHAGQAGCATGLLILVGKAGSNPRIAQGVVDAAASLWVGRAEDPGTELGPLTGQEIASTAALTELSDGEHWVLCPEDLGGGLWQPGVRAGVKPGSGFHLSEHSVPALGVMRVDTLAEAIEAVNAPGAGPLAVLHSLDPAEHELWLKEVKAPSLYVNRSTAATNVGRQPFGGGLTSIGGLAKADGPGHLLSLGEVVPTDPRQDHRSRGEGLCSRLDPRVSRIYDAVRSSLSRDDALFLHEALSADAEAWRERYGVETPLPAAAGELSVLRYQPVGPVLVRAASGTNEADLVRVICAAALSGTPVELVVEDPLRPSLRAALTAAALPMTVQHGDLRTWGACLQEWRSSVTDPNARVRVLGPRDESPHDRWNQVWRVVGADAELTVHAGAVTACPHSELAFLLREQTLCVRTHRYGVAVF
ncbi:aldehyde dehydrogenase family protein [Actinomyces trachealis]|uniref:aldehyde dehydrogenase family protein n=1 Tax=Actinomyces trachealis TaxID=2763540 RepID=UPI0018929A02|nr:aldehyde dehydrogenase family protein [Actinomyces trachealis]